jgi:DNA repair exonuclease SbcCD nuclease subunit
MKTLIINDLHLGVKRQGGTTKDSRLALETWMLNNFTKLLQIPHDRLVILGDLFDSRNVEEHVMATVTQQLRDEADCVIVAGNHDLGGVFDHTISSAELVAKLSNAEWVAEPLQVDNFYIIPHLYNQADFDKAVSECPKDTNLLLHCNVDSPFTHGDHSLNLSMQQIVGLGKRGVDVIVGHEHSHRIYSENLIVIGNQFPSSIADLSHIEKKFYMIADDSGVYAEEFDYSATFSRVHTEGTVTIEELKEVPGEFIEILGECEPLEYPAIVKAVAEFRKTSSAFIIKNSVKIRESEDSTPEQTVTKFNIVELLLDAIPELIRKDVKSCI